MSMCFHLVSIKPQNIEKLNLGNKIEEFLDEYLESQINYGVQSDHALDLDKSWDGVDFLFYITDQLSFPRNWLVESGEEIGQTWDTGLHAFGPVRW